MINYPSVSIIVPVFNTENYLRRCIDSVINQTFKDWELILVDDGSTDGSALIIKEYVEKYAQIVPFFQENGGQSKARNEGLKKCRGKYVFFLDSDDWLEENALSVLVDKIESDDVDIVCSVANFVDDSGRKSLIRRFNEPYLYNDEILIDALKVGQFLTSPWAKLYKAEFLKENNLYFPEGFVNEDTAHSIMCATLAKKVSFINILSVNVYERIGSTSRTNYEKMFQTMHRSLMVAKSFINEHKNNRYIDTLFCTRYLRSMLYNLLQSAQRNKYKYFKNDYSFCLKNTLFNQNKCFKRFLPFKHRLLIEISFSPFLFFIVVRLANAFGYRMH